MRYDSVECHCGPLSNCIWLEYCVSRAGASPMFGSNAHSKVVACFSTHPVKAIATGEGGMVTTQDEALARRMRRLRSHGMVHDASAFELSDTASEAGDANPRCYEMPEVGWNYRLPDVMCALGLSQLKKRWTAFTSAVQRSQHCTIACWHR